MNTHSYLCPKCKKRFLIDQPVITKDAYGFQSNVHECGTGYFGFVLCPKDPIFAQALLDSVPKTT